MHLTSRGLFSKVSGFEHSVNHHWGKPQEKFRFCLLFSCHLEIESLRSLAHRKLSGTEHSALDRAGTHKDGFGHGRHAPAVSMKSAEENMPRAQRSPHPLEMSTE